MSNQKWDQSKIADQSGRLAIITGASSGIGYEAARVLANKNAEVIVAVRNREKGRTAMEKIKKQKGDVKLSLMLLDLSDLESVKSFTNEFKTKYSKLDLLINNAGVMIPPYSKTADGFELQFGTNHLGHFALTGLLMDVLKNTPGSRIINVSSNAHKYGKINFDDLNWEKRKYKSWISYGDSKLANLYFTYELAKRIAENGNNPVVTAAHPGWTATELQRYSGAIEYLSNFFAQDTTMGALPILYAAVSPDVKNGDYFGPSGFMEMRGYPKRVESNARSKDEKIARQLWSVSEELTGIRFSIN